MTVSLGQLLVLAAFVCWRQKGAQFPYIVLGALIVKAAGAGSIVDELAGTGIDVVQTLVDSVAEVFGRSGVV